MMKVRDGSRTSRKRILQSMLLMAQETYAAVSGWQLSPTWVRAPSSPPVECRSALTSQNIRMVAC
jgi:hypothetical protein